MVLRTDSYQLEATSLLQQLQACLFGCNARMWHGVTGFVVEHNDEGAPQVRLQFGNCGTILEQQPGEWNYDVTVLEQELIRKEFVRLARSLSAWDMVSEEPLVRLSVIYNDEEESGKGSKWRYWVSCRLEPVVPEREQFRNDNSDVSSSLLSGSVPTTIQIKGCEGEEKVSAITGDKSVSATFSI